MSYYKWNVVIHYFSCQRRQLSSNTNKTSVTSQFKNNTCVESDDEDEHEDNAVQTTEPFVTSEDEHSDDDDEDKASEVDLQSLDKEITSIITKVHDNGAKHTAIHISSARNLYVYICNYVLFTIT